MAEAPSEPPDQLATPVDPGALMLPALPLNQGLAPQADRQAAASPLADHPPQSLPHWVTRGDADDKTALALRPEDLSALAAGPGPQLDPHPLSGQPIPAALPASLPLAPPSPEVAQPPAPVASRLVKAAIAAQDSGAAQGVQGLLLASAEQPPRHIETVPQRGDADRLQPMVKAPQSAVPTSTMPVTVQLSAAPPPGTAHPVPETALPRPALPQAQADSADPEGAAWQTDMPAPLRLTDPPPRPVLSAPAALHSQLLQHASAAIDRQVEVLLAPQELGHVKFQIRHQGETVAILLSAERGETMELLRRHGDDLMREFRQAGFSGASLEFGHWGQQPSQQQTPAAFVLPEEFAPPPPLPRPPSPAAALGDAQGLNLRL
jgi:hypothetical protein